MSPKACRPKEDPMTLIACGEFSSPKFGTSSAPTCSEGGGRLKMLNDTSTCTGDRARRQTSSFASWMILSPDSPRYWDIMDVLRVLGTIASLAIFVRWWFTLEYWRDVTLRRPGFFSFCTAKAEVQLPSSYPVRVELNVRDLSRRDDDSVSNVPVDVGGIVVDVNVLGEEDIDEQLRVMVDFDFGAIKLWQASPESTSRSFVPLGLCSGHHSVSAWAFKTSGSLAAQANTTFEVGQSRDIHTHARPTISSPDAMPDTSKSGPSGGWDAAGGECNASERQPPLLLSRGYDVKEESDGLCHVCSVDWMDHVDPSEERYDDDYIHKSPSPSPRAAGQRRGWQRQRRRLVLWTSLIATVDADSVGQQGTSTQEWPIELREGDTPAAVAEEFVARRLGLALRPEGASPEVAAGVGSHNSYSTIWREIEKGKRAVEWVTQRLEQEMADRQVRRSVIQTEAARRLSNKGQLRIILGAGPGEKNAPEYAGWVVTDAKTLDVTDSSDFRFFFGVGGVVSAFSAEHVWEHLSLHDAHRATRNCFRNLRPGGRLRLAVPDPAWHNRGLASVAATAEGGAPADHADVPQSADEVPATKLADSGHRSQGEYFRPGNTGPADRVSGQGRATSGAAGGGRENIERLPAWLSADMLAGDIRDGHLVQYTPELLANVCWSAGFTPILVEGRQGRAKPPAATTAEAEEHPGATSRTPKMPGTSGVKVNGAWTGPGVDVDENADARLWGLVRRSVAGGDPRGAVSIVMDCIKPVHETRKPKASTHWTPNATVPILSLPRDGKEINEEFLDGFLKQGSRTMMPATRPAPSDAEIAAPTANTEKSWTFSGKHPPANAIGYRSSGIGGGVAQGSGKQEERAGINSSHGSGENLLRAAHYSGGGGTYGSGVANERCRGPPCDGGLVQHDAAGSGESGTGGPNQGEHEGHTSSMSGDEGMEAALSAQGSVVRVEKGTGILGSLSKDYTPTPLHLDNRTLVLPDGMGLNARGEPIFRETVAGTPLNADDKMKDGSDGIDASSDAAMGYRRQWSLDKWVAAARQKGRVDPIDTRNHGHGVESPYRRLDDDSPVRIPASGSSEFHSAENSPASNASDNGDTALDVAHLRAGARKALLTGDIQGTLELCKSILEVHPSDPAALLYEGAALAQQGERIPARINMERVLAVASGVERTEQTRNKRTETLPAGSLERVAPDIALAAAANLASFARAGVSESLDPTAEMLFLLEGLRGAAERNRAIRLDADTRKHWWDSDATAETASGENGLIDVLVMAALALEQVGQPTSALRLYQRVALMGGNRDTRVLHGLGDLSRRFSRIEREPRSAASPDRTPAADATPIAKDTVANSTVPSLNVGMTGGRCGWTIVHPRSGQMFSPADVIGVEFDLSALDPGPPASGSPFAPAASNNGENVIAGYADVGVLVCSYLGEFRMPNCLPKGQLRDLEPGWHILTAEVYQVPGLRPFRCDGAGDNVEHSVRKVRFCVGDDLVCGTKVFDQVLPVDSAGDPPLAHSLQDTREQKPARDTHDLDHAAETSETSADVVELPFCFFTLALNAMPFITHHVPVFRKAAKILSERAAPNSKSRPGLHRHHSPPAEAFWEWHIVEGVAMGRSDESSPYSRKRIPDRYFDPDTGLSVDGTTEYLDGIVGGTGSGAERVRVHRRCQDSPKRPSALRRAAGADKIASTERSVSPMGDDGLDDLWDVGTSCFWRDKIQMVNSVLFVLKRKCLMVQIDADELWTADQLVSLRDMFLEEREVVMASEAAERDVLELSGSLGRSPKNESAFDRRVAASLLPGEQWDGAHVSGEEQTSLKPVRKTRECAYFDCHFFVGPDLVTVTEDGWGHSKSNEWLRAWVLQPQKSLWLRHAPPELASYDEARGWILLSGDACIGRQETRGRGLVFTHYAYVLEEQVRFKSVFYGHSESYSTLGSGGHGTPLDDAVAEWRALQRVKTPFLLANHLTWLRDQGFHQDTRLLTTVADRPPRHLDLVQSREGGGQLLYDGLRREGTTKNDRDHHRPDTPFVPLESFLRLLPDGGVSEKPHRLYGSREDPGRVPLAHSISMRSGRRRRPGDEETTGGVAERGPCGFLHLVVDGVEFQVNAATPSGISRVWTNVLPLIVSRLSGFEGTCLTLLVRGLAPPPPIVEKVFDGVPRGRFSYMHIPVYNPSFGFVSDQLILSWAVLNVGGTAFVSTLYTQPFRAATPGVAHVLLIHDLLPEVFGWDMSSGTWRAKRDAAATASAVVAVSQHSAREFLRIYPKIRRSYHGRGSHHKAAAARPVWVGHNGVDTSVFHPVVDDSKLGEFRNIAGLGPSVSYVLIVGTRLGYKNARNVYRAIEAGAGTDFQLALVLVGGGPVAPEELEMLEEISNWKHIGVGSETTYGAPNTLAVTVDDKLLAAAYSGAVALLHMPVGEGFGLTVLESFACGCPVVASNIPSIREIAGLPHRQQGTEMGDRVPLSADGAGGASTKLGATLISGDDDVSARTGIAATSAGSRYKAPASPLKGGLVLVDELDSATQIWRAIRALMSADDARRNAISEALVQRARVFDSWQPLADALVKAAVD